MHYLGGLSGGGMLKRNGDDVGRATYEFDVFQTKLGVTSSGEVLMPAAVLKDLFGRTDVQLLTDDGRLLDLRFSDKQLANASEAVHVDVTGDLPGRPPH